jgi:hypothetical protein
MRYVHEQSSGTNVSLADDSAGAAARLSHLLMDKVGRTAKVLFALARGAWILDTSYMDACARAGQFLPEGPHEFNRHAGIIRARLAHADPKHRGLLHGTKVFVHGKFAMDRPTLLALLREAGAQVVTHYKLATVCLSASKPHDLTLLGLTKKDLKEQQHLLAPIVPVEWLFDSLSLYELLSMESYIFK